MPDASSAAQIIPIVVNQSEPYQGIGLILGAISAFSTILFAVIAFLTWTNFKQKNEAQKLLGEIQSMYTSTVDLYKKFDGIMVKAKESLATAEKLLQNTSKNAQSAVAVIQEAQKSGSDAKKLSEEMENIKKDMNKQIVRINSAISSLPSASVSPSASVRVTDYSWMNPSTSGLNFGTSVASPLVIPIENEPLRVGDDFSSISSIKGGGIRINGDFGNEENI